MNDQPHQRQEFFGSGPALHPIDAVVNPLHVGRIGTPSRKAAYRQNVIQRSIKAKTKRQISIRAATPLPVPEIRQRFPKLPIPHARLSRLFEVALFAERMLARGDDLPGRTQKATTFRSQLRLTDFLTLLDLKATDAAALLVSWCKRSLAFHAQARFLKNFLPHPFPFFGRFLPSHLPYLLRPLSIYLFGADSATRGAQAPDFVGRTTARRTQPSGQTPVVSALWHRFRPRVFRRKTTVEGVYFTTNQHRIRGR